MGKTRDLFKKIRDIKGTFHEKMGSIKDRNGMDLTEAEDIKKRWQEYTEELYKKDLHNPDNHKGVITHLEPDILECEVKLMYGCESWTVKKSERRKIDALELWCWRRLLRVPWTARRSSQFILKEISPGCSWEGLMLKLKLQYFGRLMRRADSLEKTLMLGGIGGRRRRE